MVPIISWQQTSVIIVLHNSNIDAVSRVSKLKKLDIRATI